MLVFVNTFYNFIYALTRPAEESIVFFRTKKPVTSRDQEKNMGIKELIDLTRFVPDDDFDPIRDRLKICFSNQSELYVELRRTQRGIDYTHYILDDSILSVDDFILQFPTQEDSSTVRKVFSGEVIVVDVIGGTHVKLTGSSSSFRESAVIIPAAELVMPHRLSEKK